MEKPDGSIISFLSTRRRGSASSTIPYYPHSPRGSESPAKLRALQRKGFSGPMVSIVPMEARCKPMGSGAGRGGFETPPEPTSPKVTCMGQIKLTKMVSRSKTKTKTSPSPSPPDHHHHHRRESKAGQLIRRIFQRKMRPAGGAGKRPDAAAASAGGPPPGALSSMRRFASGRDSLRDFDWRKVLVEEDDGRDEEDEVIIAHSAPLTIGGGVVAAEPRKEVGLWKRRTLAPPVPLQLG